MVPIAVLWMGIIFSPFVAFAVNGRVDGSNWTPALVTACCCIAGIVFLRRRAARNYQQLPSQTRTEYDHGRLMPSLLHGDRDIGNVEFGPPGEKVPLVGLTPQGVWFAPAAIAGSSGPKSREISDINFMSHFAGGVRMPTHALKWDEIVEWEVWYDGDGPDYYLLTLRDKGYIKLQRPGDPEKEVQILDYVRTIGGRPVRLFCDID